MLNIFKIITIISSLFITSLFSSVQASDEQVNGLEKVSLQFQWIDQFQFAGYYIAKEKGFYKEVGLDVELRNYNQKSVIDSVTNNKATYGIGNSSLIIERSKGKNIVLLAAIYQSSPTVFIATQESGITTLKDFSGKKMMVANNASESVTLLAMLKREKVDEKSIQFIEQSFNVDDLINKKTDLIHGYISNEPFLLKEKGIKINTFNPSDYGFNFYDDILFTSDTEIKNHKQRAINFTNASLKGWEYAFSHIDETVELILKKYNSQNKSKEALLYEAHELKKLAYLGTDSIGKLDLDHVQRIYDIYNIFGYIENNIDLESFIFKYTQKQTLRLSQDEKDYLNNNKTIRFTGDPNWLPFEAFNKDGKYIGIISEFLEHIEKQTGIHFTKIVSKDWTDALNIAKNAEVDVISGDAFDEILDKNFNPIKTYIKNPVVIVMKNSYGFVSNLNDIEDKKIALIKDYGYNKNLYRDYPNIKFIEVKNIQEALLGVETGEFDASLASLATSNYFILDMGFEDLGIVGKTGTTLNVTLFVNKDKPLLHSILNKSINSLTQKERQDILRNWYQVNSTRTVDYDLLIKSTLVFIAILLFFVYRQYILNKSNKKLENLSKKLQSSHDILAQQAQMIEQTHDSVNSTDLDGNILTWNHGSEILFGYREEEVIGKHISMLHRKEDLAEFTKSIETLMQTGGYASDVILLTKSQESVWVYLSLSLIKDQMGVPVRMVGYAQDISARKEAENILLDQKDTLHYQANHDQLTGLPNRTLLLDRIEYAIKHSNRNKQDLAICMVDLDGFKEVNDSFGHDAGDSVLVEAAKRMKEEIRENDTVARLGGDEFVLILTDIASTDACALALQRVLDTLSKPYRYNNQQMDSISASIGVSIYPTDKVHSDALLRHADIAMYKSKNSGKNKFTFFDIDSEHKMQESSKILNRLRKAIDSGQLTLYYQPKYQTTSETIGEVEALVRWNHPTLGLLPPAEFLPMVENDDELSLLLDQWVVKEAFNQLKLWAEQNIELTMCINISPKQFKGNLFQDWLHQFIESDQVPQELLKYVEFEILETSLMDNLTEANEFISRLQERGISFALDDFGTGYSSLMHLKDLNINSIKIDQAFVREMFEDDASMRIVKAVIALSEAFELNITAEGAQTDKHVKALIEMGCDEIQGYSISHPLPAPDLVEF